MSDAVFVAGAIPRRTGLLLGAALVAVAVCGGGCRSSIPWITESDMRPPPPAAWSRAAETVPTPEAEVHPVAAPVQGSVVVDAVAAGCGEACTLAVLCAAPGSTGVGLAAEWEAAWALGPDHVVVLGARAAPERERGGSRTGATEPGAGGSAVLVFPGPEGADGPGTVHGPCRNATMLLVSGAALRRDTATVVAWVGQQVAEAESGLPLLVLLDEPLWTSQPEAWAQVQAPFEGRQGAGVHVIAAGARCFSWWSSGRVHFHTLGAAAARGSPAGAAPADGEFAGLLWVTLARGDAGVHVLEPSALLAPEVFSRRLQEQRRALKAACQASPIAAADGVTEVRCENPTEGPLAFDAEWRFEGGPGSVEPQVLGFRLDPGQPFRQRFRLQAGDGVPLKFAVPRLVLSTTCQDGTGGSVPVHIEVVPRVRMAGHLAALPEGVVVDGDLGDWTCGGYPLNHASQVVLAEEAWQGPGDLSATLFTAESGGSLYLALKVRASPGQATGCALLVDPRGGEGNGFGASQAPLVIRVGADGTTAVEAERVDGVSAVWRARSDGGTLEATVKSGLFVEGHLPDPLLVDAVLTRFDASGRPVTALCFSGDIPGRQSSALYGRFSRAATTTVAAPGASAAGALP